MTKDKHNSLLSIVNRAYGYQRPRTAKTISSLLDYSLVSHVYLTANVAIRSIHYAIITKYETIESTRLENIKLTHVLPGEHCRVVIDSIEAEQSEIEITANFIYSDKRINTTRQSFALEGGGGDEGWIVIKFFRDDIQGADPSIYKYEYWDGSEWVEIEFDKRNESEKITVATDDIQIRKDGVVLEDLTIANAAGYKGDTADLVAYLYTPSPWLFSYDDEPTNLSGSNEGNLFFLNASDTPLYIYINRTDPVPDDLGATDDADFFLFINDYTQTSFADTNQDMFVEVYKIEDNDLDTPFDKAQLVYAQTFSPYVDKSMLLVFKDSPRSSSINVTGSSHDLFFRPKSTPNVTPTGFSIKTNKELNAPHVADFKLPKFLR